MQVPDGYRSDEEGKNWKSTFSGEEEEEDVNEPAGYIKELVTKHACYLMLFSQHKAPIPHFQIHVPRNLKICKQVKILKF